MANRPLFRGPRVPERCVAISKPSNEGTNMWNRTTEEEAFIVVVVVVVVVFVVVAVVVVLLPGSPGPATGADSAAGAAGFESGGRFSASPLSRRRRTARSLARSARARCAPPPRSYGDKSIIESHQRLFYRRHLRGCPPPPPPPPQSCHFRFPQVRAINSGSLKIIAQTANAAATITPRNRSRNDEPDRRHRPPQSYNSRFPHPFTTTWGDLSGPSHYYGVSYGPIHVVSLNNYLPYAPGTPQASPPTHPPTLPLPHQPTTHPEA